MSLHDGVPQPARILLVEDGHIQTLLIKTALADLPQLDLLHVAKNGVEAMEFLRREVQLVNGRLPDLILLDINMPKKNGFEIYNELMEFKKIPVLFVTAYPRSFNAEQDDVFKMWESEFSEGATDIVYKPFHMDTLFEKVESMIGTAEPVGDSQ